MNEERQRVILYGDSVILAAMQASLSGFPNLEVISLEQSPSSLMEGWCDLHLAAVVFDLASVSPDFPLVLLQQANLLLIGINPETHQAHVWSGQQQSELSMQDLVQVIHKKILMTRIFKGDEHENPN